MASFAVYVVIYSSIFGLSNAYGEYSKLERFAVDPFYPAFQKELALERYAKQEILKRFGQPLKEEAVIKPNYRDPGGVDGIEYSTLYYEGMVIRVITDMTPINHIPHTPSYVKEIQITSPKYKLVYGLSIGTDKKHYIDSLGKEYNEDLGALVFDASIYHRILIKFSDAGKSESITWLTDENSD